MRPQRISRIAMPAEVRWTDARKPRPGGKTANEFWSPASRVGKLGCGVWPSWQTSGSKKRKNPSPRCLYTYREYFLRSIGVMASAQFDTFFRHLRRVVLPRAAPELTDAQLLERFVQLRDEAVFELLLWRHGPAVIQVCLRVLPSWRPYEPLGDRVEPRLQPSRDDPVHGLGRRWRPSDALVGCAA
jgi:hypothetical protein